MSTIETVRLGTGGPEAELALLEPIAGQVAGARSWDMKSTSAARE